MGELESKRWALTSAMCKGWCWSIISTRLWNLIALENWPDPVKAAHCSVMLLKLILQHRVEVDRSSASRLVTLGRPPLAPLANQRHPAEFRLCWSFLSQCRTFGHFLFWPCTRCSALGWALLNLEEPLVAFEQSLLQWEAHPPTRIMMHHLSQEEETEERKSIEPDFLE